MKAPAADSLDGAPVVTAIAQVALACSDLVGVRRCADETPRRRRAGRLASALTPRVAIVQEDPEQTERDGHDALAVRRQRRLRGRLLTPSSALRPWRRAQPRDRPRLPGAVPPLGHWRLRSAAPAGGPSWA